MDGDTPHEEAWRAFDVDLQADHDAQLFTGSVTPSIELFDDIADEFDIETAADSTTELADDGEEFAHAWQLLGVWLVEQESPSPLETAARYNHILDTLGLEDDGWSELRTSARASA
jgi:hypothetical protein